jgi:Flp pilus assembly protein TadG
MNRHAGERGSAALEAVIIFPVVVLLLGGAIAAGRIAIAGAAVEAAARDAARQASIARTPEQARAAAQTSATTALQQEGLRCTPTVQLDVSGFTRPVGTPAAVQATVSCTVALADVALPILPGSKTLNSSFSSPLDLFRGRQ